MRNATRQCQGDFRLRQPHTILPHEITRILFTITLPLSTSPSSSSLIMSILLVVVLTKTINRLLKLIPYLVRDIEEFWYLAH